MSMISNDVVLPAPPMAPRRRWIWWLAAVVGTLVIVGIAWFWLMLRSMALENTPPPNLDVSRTRSSAQGLYRGSYTPSLDPITINQLHSWTFHLETADGQSVETADITVHGDMPGHGHGLPTKPIVSPHRGNGDYLVEGMKFQMPGWWHVEFTVVSGGKQDMVRFDFVLK